MLQEFIKDEDSYVRKTGAICISKLFDLSSLGLLKLLEYLLNDDNAMIVANALCLLFKNLKQQHYFNQIHILFKKYQKPIEWG
ncbi:unnamed protein product [Paramecium sonneborni]|uniref:Condensin complex subunit 1 C-terminal domain-containing protein n=1 Tax=Paramecium sonneborni TaxID=65129 RepID=A0A8S1R4E4_9CILI|nr:unnamed protein product [Paramecium sonneborni]